METAGRLRHRIWSLRRKKMTVFPLCAIITIQSRPWPFVQAGRQGIKLIRCRNFMAADAHEAVDFRIRRASPSLACCASPEVRQVLKVSPSISRFEGDTLNSGHRAVAGACAKWSPRRGAQHLAHGGGDGAAAADQQHVPASVGGALVEHRCARRPRTVPAGHAQRADDVYHPLRDSVAQQAEVGWRYWSACRALQRLVVDGADQRQAVVFVQARQGDGGGAGPAGPRQCPPGFACGGAACPSSTASNCWPLLRQYSPRRTARWRPRG